ncbi:MAG: hypothetical protein PF569_01305 [Candidatus Woesearchaeota archaeon]|nr:hypothetical protein [Candidatus Woesearchaeota archaeon]
MKTILKLQKFLIEKRVEWHYFVEYDKEDVVIFINDYDYEEFKEVLSDPYLYDEDGFTIILKDTYLAIKMEQILDRLDLLLEDVFDKEEKEE